MPFLNFYPKNKTPILTLIFLFISLVGVATAYDQGTGWSQLLFVLISVCLFFTFSFQPKKQMWSTALFFTFLGAAMAGYFLLTNDWQQNPAKIGLINQVGTWWMSIRPQVFSGSIYHNSAAGVMALSLPFTLMSGIHAWQKKDILRVVVMLAFGAFTLLGFVSTTSHGATLALFYGLIIWFLYELSKRLRDRVEERWLIGFRLVGIPLIIIAAGWSFMILAGPVSLSNEHTVPTYSGSRLELYQDSIKLVEDFPFTGVGLGAFPGAYSTYILVIPNFFFQTAHNLYLNVAIEQGIFGFLAFVAIYLISLWSLLKYRGNQESLLVGAVLSSQVIILLHNMFDTVIGDSVLVVLLFALPGFTYAVVNPSLPVFRTSVGGGENKPSPGKNWSITKTRNSIALIITIITFFSLLVFHKPLLSTWFSNLGAVQMAKIDLAGFPTNFWSTGENLTELALAEANFLQSLQYNPANRTANHRLGLIAMMRRDFPAAVTYLEKAYQFDPDHRGIVKNLGYAYTWTGQFEKAFPLLKQIPESQNELDVYSWWWGTLDRQDLAKNAFDMEQKLKEAS